MNNNSIQIFQTVALRPHVLQYVINEFPAICLSIAAFWIYVFGKFMWHEYFIYAALFWLYICSVSYCHCCVQNTL